MLPVVLAFVGIICLVSSLLDALHSDFKSAWKGIAVAVVCVLILHFGYGVPLV